MKKLIKKALKLILPLVLGGFILYWVYRDFDFAKAGDVLRHGVNWWWMLFSRLALEADIGTFGRFSENERLCKCYFHFLCYQSYITSGRRSVPLWCPCQI